MVNQNKKNQVDNLITSLKKNSNFFLAKISGTSHANLEKLRKELRKNSSVVKVVKNSYFEKAVNKMAIDDKKYVGIKKSFFPLKDSSAIIFVGQSWDKGLKTFSEFVKTEKTLSFKMSFLDNCLYGSAETERISLLPSQDHLIAKIIGSMKSPVSKFINDLKYNTNKLVYVLQAKSKEVKS